jgi:hypothetical protein
MIRIFLKGLVQGIHKELTRILDMVFESMMRGFGYALGVLTVLAMCLWMAGL